MVHPAAGNWTGTLVNALIAHCGASLSGIGGVAAARHRAPARQGHHRPDGGGQDRPRPPGARGASSPTTAAAGRSSAAISPSSGACRSGRRAPSTSRSTATRSARDKMAVRAGRPRGRHPLGGAGALSRAGRQAGREPARLPAGDRPHPPDPGASGPYRPSAPGRRHLRHRLQDQGGPARPGGPRRAGRPLDGRPCMPIYWASNTRSRADRWSSARNFRPILRVYATASATPGPPPGPRR